eukprot:CAMPEP_0171060160 /NCGR_PEP_ID=MMETSP0766_2-20121228/3658_1 /TAXON_ID=439317 /ORGANISM="Gambierdiscus australes, Strain CAWD 149" /LENGTH=50 /DNA_ID=CAMNT_0011515707 /DNA_START=76 /DNA_END=225 /DNA_ORIENTATION=-
MTGDGEESTPGELPPGGIIPLPTPTPTPAPPPKPLYDCAKLGLWSLAKKD